MQTLTQKKTQPKAKRKLLFLDIDGVCNSENFAIIRAGKGVLGIDPYPAMLVKQLVEETACEVVLSSTWRLWEDGRQQVRDEVIDFIDVTPDLRGAPRGEEIEKWLTDNDCLDANFAILDDDCDMLVWQAPHFFKTSWKEGLTPEIKNAVVDYLNGQKYVRCARCGERIHIDNFAGVKMGEHGEEYYCKNLICLMHLTRDEK